MPRAELLEALARAGIEAFPHDGPEDGPESGGVRCPADRAGLAAVVAFAHGWVAETSSDGLDLRLGSGTP